MPDLIHNPVSKAVKREETANVAQTYRSFHDEEKGGNFLVRKQRCKDMVNQYYDLFTDFYEYGWDQFLSFCAAQTAGVI